jgi:hypothetical protein
LLALVDDFLNDASTADPPQAREWRQLVHERLAMHIEVLADKPVQTMSAPSAVLTSQREARNWLRQASE